MELQQQCNFVELRYHLLCDLSKKTERLASRRRKKKVDAAATLRRFCSLDFLPVALVSIKNRKSGNLLLARYDDDRQTGSGG